MQLEPGCIAVVVQQTKTVQEGIVLTPNQVKWIITILTQIMQNASIRLPLRVSQYSASQMSSLFWCCESSGPRQRCLQSFVVQELWDLWGCDGYTVLSTLKIWHAIHRWCFLGKGGPSLSMFEDPWTVVNIVIVSLSAARLYGIYKSAEAAISRRALAFITTWYIATLLCNTGFVRSRWIVSMLCARKGFRHRALSGDTKHTYMCWSQTPKSFSGTSY